MKNVLITGGTGMVGRALTALLIKNGFNVSHLSRQKSKSSIKTFIWDVDNQFIDVACLKNCDAIIHLAGAGIADQKWSKKRKKEILESRTNSSELLFNTLKTNPNKVKIFVGASASGFYGIDNSSELVNENSPAGTDFLAIVTKVWEDANLRILNIPIKTILLRIGIVLANESGALPKIKQPIEFGIGASLASGKQYLSWIHIEDLCEIFHHALIKPEMNGIYNAIAPNPVDNQTLTNEIAVVLSKKIWLPNVPSFVLSLALGEMAMMVTKGKNIDNKRLKEINFSYKFPEIKMALEDLLIQNRS
ncbi:MAG: TIGR01777 family protein [Cytophagales bacterium]|nr:MAG: TIGR01777 family protein [Cytophagales bacterium]